MPVVIDKQVFVQIASGNRQNRENFAIWRRVLGAVLEVRTILKKIAPTLYSNVVDCYSAAGRTS
jgi:hypothetical protein